MTGIQNFTATLCMLVVSSVALAHEYKGMSTQIIIEPTSASIILNIAALDTLLLAPPADRDRNGRMSREEFDFGKMSLESGVPFMLKFTSDGIPVLPESTHAEVKSTEGFTNEPHTIEFTMTYSAPASGQGKQFGRVRIDPNLFRSFVSSPVDGSNIVGTQRNTVTILDRGKQVTLQATGHEVYDSGDRLIAAAGFNTTATASTTSGTTEAQKADATSTIKPATTETSTSLWRLMLDYLREGVWHILKGWDHVFFVVGIILIAPNLRNLVKVITAFTIAHSITLILTSLEVVKISRPQIVEAIIAASVAYVGIENLIMRDRTIPWRWALVFGFGLIHGLGFASVLRELLGAGGMTAGSKGQLVACLLTFNVGVEIGQMLILCLIWPTLQALRNHSPKTARYVFIAASTLIFIMGTSFLLDRTIIPGKLPWVEWFNG